MSKYHNLYKGFQKIFGASRSSSTPKNLRGNMSTTIVGVKPAKNLAEKKKAADKLIKSRDKILQGMSKEIKLDVKTKNPLSKYKEKIRKIVDKKANGGRIGLKHGSYETVPPSKGFSEYVTKEKQKKINEANKKANEKDNPKAGGPMGRAEAKVGGRMGRRFGGDTMPKRKTNVEKIKETFAPKKKNLSPKQMKIAKLAGNPNKIDGADFKKLRNR